MWTAGRPHLTLRRCYLHERKEVYLVKGSTLGLKTSPSPYTMVDSPQTRILWKVGGQLLHDHWWLDSRILDVQTLLHFGPARLWAEEDWDAARSFCLLRLSFAASCLSASNL